MAKNIAIIKGRVLEYVDSQGIKKENFYKKIYMNGQSWRGKGAESELRGDKIATVLSEYRDINPYWLFQQRMMRMRCRGCFLIDTPWNIYTCRV